MKDQLEQSVIDANEAVATAMTSALFASGADGYGANVGIAMDRAKRLVAR